MSRQKTVVGAILLSISATLGVIACNTLGEPRQTAALPPTPSNVALAAAPTVALAAAPSLASRPASTTASAPACRDQPFPPRVTCNSLPPPTGAPCPNQPTVSPDIPCSLPCTKQGSANCLAWQDFLALNWPASATVGEPDRDASVGEFGEPGDAGAFQQVVWETYKTEGEVFRPTGVPPVPWDAAIPTPTCGGRPVSTSPRGHKAAAFLRGENLLLSPEFTPASATQPGGPTAWIADNAGNLVWYEIAMNQVEDTYIVGGQLYKAENQWALSVPGKEGVSPPEGSIEIKAAWRQIEDPALYSRYLMVSSCIPTRGSGSKPAQLGLVGFHIVHKVKYQPQWVWATFEQIDNAPTLGSDAGPPTDAGFSFNNPRCAASSVPRSCWPSDAGPCAPNTQPSFDLAGYFDGKPDACAPYATPIVRDTPIPDAPTGTGNQVATINKAVQATIRAASPKSVFQYYQLVNAMWWQGSPVMDQMDGGVAAPLSTTKPTLAQPPLSNGPIANTVLETYDQLSVDDAGTTSTCLACHQFAHVPTVAGSDAGRCGNRPCAADFSFMFSKAKVANPSR